MLFTNLSQSLDQNVEVDSVLEDAQKLSDFMDKEELLTLQKQLKEAKSLIKKKEWNVKLFGKDVI